jgi:hypothetical protein
VTPLRIPRSHQKRIALIGLIVTIVGWLAWTMLTVEADLTR